MFHIELREFRLNKKMTLKRFCVRTGIDSVKVSQWERQCIEEGPTEEELTKMKELGFSPKTSYVSCPIAIAKEKEFYNDMKNLSKEEFLLKHSATGIFHINRS